MGDAMITKIIPRPEHAISRKQLNRSALQTLYRLQDHGFTAYLVGGCVRDLILGRIPKDFDICTNATPGQIKKMFRNCRLVGRRFRLAHLHFRDEIIEVATFRATAANDDGSADEANRPDSPPRHLKNEDGMIIRDNIFGTPEEDALRRDFTINALAYNIADYSVIDFTGGLTDLEQRLIRPIGDPLVRFTEDPVRMIRAIRFAATLDFAIEQETWNIIRNQASTIKRAAPARLYEEILKLFLLGSAGRVFVLLEESGLLKALFPWLNRWLQGGGGRSELINKTLQWLDNMVHEGTPPSVGLMLAALFGPSLEDQALVRHRAGIPYQQALHACCSSLYEELRETLSFPAKVGNQLRNILSLQPSLRKFPPRRPGSLVNRQDFAAARNYLRIMADAKGETLPARDWWDAYIEGRVIESSAEAVPAAPAAKRARKKRRRRRSPPPKISNQLL
ncbi:MAG: poly(A) polymerase [Deltaproteobacteria bacterium HGW-Deltaproteobacteria-12]|jgi:poly(A) polymerase|nr:MAG: poly(A) polymerase [Deltaproteobacteria bacterium HGW-Deltaproteobacteria-12]